MIEDAPLQLVAPVPPSRLAERLDHLEALCKTYHQLFQLQTPKKWIPELKLREMQRECVAAESAACAGCPEFDGLQATTTVEELLDHGALGGVVRFVGRVGAFSSPEIWSTAGSPDQVYKMSFEDSEGRDLSSLTVSSRSTWEPLQRALRLGAPVDVLGTIFVLTDHRGSHPVFMPLRARLLESCLAAIGATEAGIRDAELLLHEGLSDPSGLPRFIIQKLRESLGVVGDGMTGDFELAELAAVLQAATIGQLSNANPRAHLLLVGQPGSGKKVISSYVDVLQPVLLPAQASTLTRAGLTAGALRKKGGLVAQPGLIPRAHLGGVAIEDLHGLRASQRDQVFAVLAQVLEDGVVDLSNQANQRFVSATALYLDVNRQSQLRADAQVAVGGPRAMVADLGLRVDLLTRIDLILELPAIAEETIESAQAMCGADTGEQGKARTQRRLKVMMAMLRDRHPQVDLEPVVEEMQQALKKLIAPLNGCRTDDFDPSTFYRRMANSLRKLVAAAARLADRSVAQSSDVGLVVELLQPKVEFIRTLATAIRNLDDKPSRLAAIRRLFGGRVVSPAQVMDALGIPRRTVMRDLNEIGEREGRGKYRIPEIGGECAVGTSSIEYHDNQGEDPKDE